MGEIRQLFKAVDRRRRGRSRDYVLAPLENLDGDAWSFWMRLTWIAVYIIAIFAGASLLLILAAWWFGVLAAAPLVLIHDDGHWAAADPAMHEWFDRLASGKGLCCSFADGRSITDVDWGTEAVADGEKTVIRYWVVVDGQKLAVPPDAVVTEPNKFGPAVVWPYQDVDGKTQIRCFLPGAQS